MSLFGVQAKKENDLRQRMAALGICEADLVEKFVRGSGRGGQKINKTSSCVYLFHRPTGIEVKCQRERSQAVNRFLARRELCEKIAALRARSLAERQQEIARIRRQKRRRSRRQKARLLVEKRLRGERKALRRPPAIEE